MVIGTNPSAEPKEFEEVLEKGRGQLEKFAETNLKNFFHETSSSFEDTVFDVLKESAIGTKFDNCIEKISGHKFPDIVFKNQYYGVEVKSLRHDGWSTFGNSIFESTRPENIDRIYVLAGRLTDPVEFRYKRYEDCIDDIQVTHSPRYHINMDIKGGELTIFQKIKIPYENFRELPDLIEPIRKYYKDNLKKGGTLWWLDKDDDPQKGQKLVVEFFNDLTKEEREIILIKAFALFPGLFGNNPKKYRKLISWMVAEQGVIISNTRDFFTAGGTIQIRLDGKTYKKIPQIYRHLKGNVKLIKNEIDKLTKNQIEEYWGVEIKDEYKAFQKWVELAVSYSKPNLKASGLPLKEMILEELKF